MNRSSVLKRLKQMAPLAVAGLTFLLYASSIGYDFAALDDQVFVYQNPLVVNGVTAESVKGAWTSAPEAYWAPLLWMSFMLDVECFGMTPMGFHWTNVLLFSLNAGLLCWLVRRWTGGRTGVALFVSLLWAFHPARVESVAWITERKDVLSGLFFLLGIGAYVEGRRGNLAGGAIWAWAFLVLGGMVKQVMIVMPAAMILLDIWPLKRTSWGRLWRDIWKLATEKWAFWAVAVALASLPIWFHHERGAMIDVTLGHRLAMIPIHYLFYFQKLAWPVGLMPLQADLPFQGWAWMAGVGIIGMVAGVAWRERKRHPWMLMGWLWFIGLLFPLTGLVWAGQERLATRFTYLPQIGLMLALVLGGDGLLRKWGWKSRSLAFIGLALVSLYAAQTLRLLPHWRNLDTFSEWAWKYNGGHETACLLGGDWYVSHGEWGPAEAAYAQGTMRQNKKCMVRLGLLRVWRGQMADAGRLWRAYEETRKCRVLDFTLADVAEERARLWMLRGQILKAEGDLDGAIAALKEAVAADPDPSAFAVAELLRTCHEAGKPEEGSSAAARLKAERGIDIRSWGDLLPRYLQFWLEGGRGLAYGYFSDYARQFPDEGMALNNMAWVMATAEPDGLDHARMDEWPAVALDWARRAVELSGGTVAGAWDTLGAAQANAGDFEGAAGSVEQALKLAQKDGDWILASKLRMREDSYRAGRPWREPDQRAEKAKRRTE